MKENTIKKMARILRGANLVFADISHLTFARQAFSAQVPDWVPLQKDDIVLYSGLAETALGSCLALTNKKHQKDVGQIAASFLWLFFPATFPSTPTG